MASPSESSSKRRPGRRRLPPLEPGPALQFVVANHPDHFRAGKTMRNVRSHVMYKHRIERKSSSDTRTNTNLSFSAGASRATSPLGASNTDFLSPVQARPRSGTWSGPPSSHTPYTLSPSPLRTLIHHLLFSARVTHARSAPPVFEDAPAFPFPGLYTDTLSHLQAQYVDLALFFSHDRNWMQTICSDPVSFLSHVSISSVYQDLADGLGHDSATTVHVKTYALSTIAGRLESSDATILGILHLLLSEVGGDEGAFRVHCRGLMGLVERRGGLSALPDKLGGYLGLTLITLSALKGFPVSVPVPVLPQAQTNIWPSPLYAPDADFARLEPHCAPETLALIEEMYNLTQSITTATTPLSMRSLPSRLHDTLVVDGLEREERDWLGKATRLASLLFLSLLNTPQSTTNTNTLTTLVHALHHTDLHSSWGDMRGVLIWICLVGAACSTHTHPTHPAHTHPSSDTGTISSPTETAFAHRFFSLHLVRAVVGCPVEESGGVWEGVRRWRGVVDVLSRGRGVGM